MDNQLTHEVRITAESLEDLREILGISGDLRGGELDLGGGVVLKDASVIKSSGFDTTQYLLQGVMTIVTSTSSALLIAYLKDRLLKKPGATATVDGKVIDPQRSDD